MFIQDQKRIRCINSDVITEFTYSQDDTYNLYKLTAYLLNDTYVILGTYVTEKRAKEAYGELVKAIIAQKAFHNILIDDCEMESVLK